MNVMYAGRPLVYGAAALLFSIGTAAAQERSVRVVTPEGQPIPYAFVQVNGGRAYLTDENGRVSIGAGKKQTLPLDVRRIGYTPFYGKIDFPDTAVTVPVVLSPIAQSLGSVNVTANKAQTPLERSGFYRRWLAAQRGASSAIFIGPEEISKRNSSRISTLMGGVNGLSMGRTSNGGAVVTSSSGSCAMAVVIDGHQVCPVIGCGMDDGSMNGLTDQNSVLIDDVIDVASVAGIEVYRRGSTLPVDFNVLDNGCGVVAFWTGSRRR